MDMNSNFLKNKIGGALLGVSLLLGIVVASSVTAQAQWQDDRWEQNRRNDDYNNGRQRDDRNNRRDDRYNNRGRNRRGNSRYNDGYADWGGSPNFRQTALNEGYNEGIKEGRNDRRKGDHFDFTDEKEFQKGTKSYNSREGDRALYSRYFRDAFSHGYEAGYNGN